MEKLKSCFQVQSSNYNKPLHGTVVSVEDVVECFEVDEFSETLQIPVEFIKKLRIFEFTRNGGRASVQPTHQSFLEFSCALSLCSEMQKVADAGDISLLFFSAGANFWAVLGHFWAILAMLGHFWANLGNIGSFLGYFG